MYSIIYGAEINDLNHVKLALADDPRSINGRDRALGVTALHIAAGDGNRSLVEYLVEQPGCKLDIEDYKGRTPALLAIIVGRDDIADIIHSAIIRKIETQFPEGVSFVEGEHKKDAPIVVPFTKPPRPNEP